MATGFWSDGRRKEVDADLLRERLQLLDRRGPIDVGATRAAPSSSARSCSSRASLPPVVVLPAPCRPASRITAGGCVARLSGTAAAAHQRGELAMHDADQRLARRQRADDFLAERLLRHRRDEVLDHRQRDVGFEQREAHFAQRVLDVVFGEPRLAAQRLDDARQAFGQIVEHAFEHPGRRAPGAAIDAGANNVTIRTARRRGDPDSTATRRRCAARRGRAAARTRTPRSATQVAALRWSPIALVAARGRARARDLHARTGSTSRSRNALSLVAGLAAAGRMGCRGCSRKLPRRRRRRPAGGRRRARCCRHSGRNPHRFAYAGEPLGRRAHRRRAGRLRAVRRRGAAGAAC